MSKFLELETLKIFQDFSSNQETKINAGILHTAFVGKYIHNLLDQLSSSRTAHNNSRPVRYSVTADSWINIIKEKFPNIKNPANGKLTQNSPSLKNVLLVFEGAVALAMNDTKNTYYSMLKTGINFLLQFYTNNQKNIDIGKVRNQSNSNDIKKMKVTIKHFQAYYTYCLKNKKFEATLAQKPPLNQQAFTSASLVDFFRTCKKSIIEAENREILAKHHKHTRNDEVKVLLRRIGAYLKNNNTRFTTTENAKKNIKNFLKTIKTKTQFEFNFNRNENKKIVKNPRWNNNTITFLSLQFAYQILLIKIWYLNERNKFYELLRNFIVNNKATLLHDPMRLKLYEILLMNNSEKNLTIAIDIAYFVAAFSGYLDEANDIKCTGNYMPFSGLCDYYGVGSPSPVLRNKKSQLSSEAENFLQKNPPPEPNSTNGGCTLL